MERRELTNAVTAQSIRRRKTNCFGVSPSAARKAWCAWKEDWPARAAPPPRVTFRPRFREAYSSAGWSFSQFFTRVRAFRENTAEARRRDTADRDENPLRTGTVIRCGREHRENGEPRLNRTHRECMLNR